MKSVAEASRAATAMYIVQHMNDRMTVIEVGVYPPGG
jgi:hypothetical protein